MIKTTVSYPHLFFGDNGLPVVERVNFKAIQIIANHVAYGWSAEELVINFPQLTLGEVYSSLAWFSDHREDVVAHLKQQASSAKAKSLEERHSKISAKLKGGQLQPSS